MKTTGMKIPGKVAELIDSGVLVAPLEVNENSDSRWKYWEDKSANEIAFVQKKYEQNQVFKNNITKAANLFLDGINIWRTERKKPEIDQKLRETFLNREINALLTEIGVMRQMQNEPELYKNYDAIGYPESDLCGLIFECFQSTYEDKSQIRMPHINIKLTKVTHDLEDGDKQNLDNSDSFSTDSSSGDEKAKIPNLSLTLPKTIQSASATSTPRASITTEDNGNYPANSNKYTTRRSFSAPAQSPKTKADNLGMSHEKDKSNSGENKPKVERRRSKSEIGEGNNAKRAIMSILKTYKDDLPKLVDFILAYDKECNKDIVLEWVAQFFADDVGQLANFVTLYENPPKNSAKPKQPSAVVLAGSMATSGLIAKPSNESNTAGYHQSPPAKSSNVSSNEITHIEVTEVVPPSQSGKRWCQIL